MPFLKAKHSFAYTHCLLLSLLPIYLSIHPSMSFWPLLAIINNVAMVHTRSEWVQARHGPSTERREWTWSPHPKQEVVYNCHPFGRGVSVFSNAVSLHISTTLACFVWVFLSCWCSPCVLQFSSLCFCGGCFLGFGFLVPCFYLFLKEIKIIKLGG